MSWPSRPTAALTSASTCCLQESSISGVSRVLSACQYGDPFDSPCVLNAAAVRPFSDAQTKLANDYCAACAATDGQTTSACVTTFWGLDQDAGVGGGPGAIAFPSSDAVVARIEATCLGLTADAGASVCSAFGACAFRVVTEAAPATPTACTQAP